MVETIRTREIEFFNELRNVITDPLGRADTKTDTFSGDDLTVAFTLTKIKVKNITSITVGGVVNYIGYHYSLDLGEGNEKTIITFKTAPATGVDNIIINYEYGHTIVYEGFQRLDAELPRISVMLRGANPQFSAVGEDGGSESGNNIWWVVTYTAEIRSKYAKQMKTVMNDFATQVSQLRQKTPQLYKTVQCQVVSVVPYDFDNELRLYRAQVTYQVKWLVKFKD